METKQLMIIAIAAAVIVVAGVAVYFLTADNNKNTTNDDSGDTDETTVVTVEDSVGRTVEVPENFDNGIVAVGWNVLKVLSFFDAHEHVTEVDYQEAQPMLGSLQPHYYCYDMSTIKTHEDTTMGGFSESTIEQIASENPSLVIMTSNVYNKYQTGSDALAKACPLVVLQLDSMSGYFYTVEDDKYVLQSDIKKSLSILGDVLGESDRDEEVVTALESTLADIKTNALTDCSTLFNLAGSAMAMGSGDINLVFPMFPPFEIAGAKNAAAEGGYTIASGFYTTLTPETFTTDYDFDVIMYDPTAPATLANPDDQAILQWLYGLQGTDDEKEIYITLTTALCGFEMMNVIADAYHTEVVGGSITLDQMESKMTALYKTLYGDTVGGSMWANLYNTMTARGAASEVFTGLYEQAKVIQKEDGTYTLGAYSA